MLKQKRLYENQRDQLYNQQFNVEQTSFMMENVQDSVQTVQAMKAAGRDAHPRKEVSSVSLMSVIRTQMQCHDS